MQNARVTAFTVSELLRENQQGGGGDKITPPPTQIRVKPANYTSVYDVLMIIAWYSFRQVQLQIYL